jgi:hypothetical protein
MVQIGAVAGLALGVACALKAARAWRNHEKYVFAAWDGGALLRGRAVAPRWGFISAMIGLALGALLAFGATTGRWPRRPAHFRIPEGWIDLSASAPAANYDRVPEPLRSAIRASAEGVDVVALDVNRLDTSAALFAGTTHPGGALTERSVDELFEKTLKKETRAVSVRRISRSLTTLDGIAFGRAEFEIEDDPPRRMRFYVIPFGASYAIVSCTYATSATDTYATICDRIGEENVREVTR